MNTEKQEEKTIWAVVEIYGHKKFAGLVHGLEGEIQLIRFDIPKKGEEYQTVYYNRNAIFSLTPCTEETARTVSTAFSHRPVGLYEVPHLAEMRQAYEEKLGDKLAELGEGEEDDDEEDYEPF